MNDRILFNKVVTIRPFYFALVGFFIVAPIAFITAKILGNTLLYAGAKLWGIFLGLVVALLIFRALRKTIQITFNESYINLMINKKTINYLKSDLLGFYSFDYRRALNYTTSICFIFKNGKRLHISDYSLRPVSRDEERKTQLINFTKIMEEQMDFLPRKEDKVRKFFRLGYTWFSR